MVTEFSKVISEIAYQKKVLKNTESTKYFGVQLL